MHNAAAELEKPFAWVTVAFVLLDSVLDRLLCQAILELEGCDGQPIYEQAQIERTARLIHAIRKLARN